MIPIATLMCPLCKQGFDTESPLTSQELKDTLAGETENRPEAPGKKGAIIVFIGGLTGILAPVNLPIGGIWYARNRRALKELSPTHNLLAIVGLVFSALYLLLGLIGIFVSKGY
jgi:hypothetical protein